MSTPLETQTAHIDSQTWFDYFDSARPASGQPYTTYVFLHGLGHNKCKSKDVFRVPVVLLGKGFPIVTILFPRYLRGLQQYILYQDNSQPKMETSRLTGPIDLVLPNRPPNKEQDARIFISYICHIYWNPLRLSSITYPLPNLQLLPNREYKPALT
jgi:hypothetical protein